MNRSYGHSYGLIGNDGKAPATAPVYRTPGGAMNNPAEQTALITGGAIAGGLLLLGLVLAMSGKKKR